METAMYFINLIFSLLNQMYEEDKIYLFLIIISEGLSLYLLKKLWDHKKIHIIEKIFWSIVLFVPFLGLIFHIAFFNKPPSLPPSEQAGRSAGDTGGAFL